MGQRVQSPEDVTVISISLMRFFECLTFVYLFVDSVCWAGYVNGTFHRGITKPFILTFTGGLYWNSAFDQQWPNSKSAKNNKQTKLLIFNFEKIVKLLWNSNFQLTRHYVRRFVFKNREFKMILQIDFSHDCLNSLSASHPLPTELPNLTWWHQPLLWSHQCPRSPTL